MAELLDLVDETEQVQDLEMVVAARAAKTPGLSNTDRATLASRIQAKARALGLRLQISDVRKWLVNRSYDGFPNITEEGYPLSTAENLMVLLDRLGIVIRYNVIKKSIDVLIPGHTASRDNRANVALAILTSECEKARMSPRHLQAYITQIADKNKYNPVTTWIESEPWDGVSRLQEFYSTVKSHTPLKELLIRKWLLQCVAAAAAPDGIATQGVLTFTGAQGIGKTTWFTRLAPSALDVILTGHTLDTRSKDSVFIALSNWIVELGELDATMRKSDIAALKAFITQAQDRLRRPYAAIESEFGRRTSFCGSVNDVDFLYDMSGNRRFWTVPVTSFELNDTIDMQQVWAEVYALFVAGEAHYLSQEEMAELEIHNEDFIAVDPIEERLASYFDWSQTLNSCQWITATEALIRTGIQNPNRSQAISAGRAIGKLNGGQRRKSNGRTLLAVPNKEFLS
jgi:putative DNA primase/helicase